MPRHEQQREDILREATALAERAELEIPGLVEPITIGFRRSGCASVFITQDAVFQFNSRSELRRGYQGGRLIKADRGQLVWLERQRTESQVVMRSSAMTSAEAAAILDDLHRCFARILSAFADGTLRILRQEPPDAPVGGRIRAWLQGIGAHVSIADRPHAV